VAVDETKLGWLCLALALTLSAGLFSRSSGGSGAYFVDAQSGTIGGVLAGADPVPSAPYRIEPGASKALHWGPGDDGPASGLSIAQLDLTGSMYLDFGEVPAGHGDSRPDVFRLVSLAGDARTVTFDVTGPMADIVTDVSLGDGASDTLAGGATSRVRMRIRIPAGASPGTYAGTIAVHVQGWAEDVRLPMTIDVCATRSGASDAKQVAPDPGGASDADPSAEMTATTFAGAEEPALPAAPAPAPGLEPLPYPEPTSTPMPTSTPAPTTTVGVTSD
jgi:hypothetical protein